MRKLKACIHINAPVQTVESLTAGPNRAAWMAKTDNLWIRTLGESWAATECEGGTRVSLQMQYRSRLPFAEPLLTDGVSRQVASSLTRLKEIAESQMA